MPARKKIVNKLFLWFYSHVVPIYLKFYKY